MKNTTIHICLSLFFAFTTQLHAEENQTKEQEITIDLGTARNIGLRLANGVMISHQRSLETGTQLEFNVGICQSNQSLDLQLCTSYQWLFPFVTIEELEWYAGPALRLGCFDIQHGAQVNMGIGALAGIAYTGALPFQFSLDISPAKYVFYKGPWTINMGIGIRYFL